MAEDDGGVSAERLQSPLKGILDSSTIVQRLLGAKKNVSEKTFLRVAGVIFLLLAIVHLLRLVFRWDLLLAGRLVPMWISAVAVVIAAALAYEGFQLSGRD